MTRWNAKLQGARPRIDDLGFPPIANGNRRAPRDRETIAMDWSIGSAIWSFADHVLTSPELDGTVSADPG